MHAKITLLKSGLLALLLFISSTAFSATYYMCSGTTITISDPPVIANVSYAWDVKLNGLSVTYPGAPGKPTGMPTAAGTYLVSLTSSTLDPNICAPSTLIHDIIVLPALTITLGTPTNASYCGTASTPSSIITPTPGGFPAGLPYSNDLEYEYTYSVVRNTDAPVNGTTVGTIGANGAYTLTTTVAGTYVITGTVKYKNKTGGTGTLISSSNGCPTASTTQTITVTTAPAAPTITIG